MIKISNVFNFLLVLAMMVSVSACVDTDFDEPESGLIISDDDVMDIADVLALIPNSGLQKIDLVDSLFDGETKYIKATVTADDESGNIFKNLYFQDATGALTINPDKNELNAEFPEGNIIYIKLNGLVLGRDEGLPKLAYAVNSSQYQRIPEALVSEFLFAGSKADSLVMPERVTLEQLLSNTDEYYNKLVTVTEVEVSNDFVGQPFAVEEGGFGVDVSIQDCSEQVEDLILRNSTFSSFATQIMPTGNGSMTGVLSKFRSTNQFFIRQADDLDFFNERCDGSSLEFPENELSLEEIKNQYLTLGVDKIPEGFISGVVISDRSQSNILNRNLIFQSGQAGIILRFGATHNYSLGEKLKVNVSGQSFSTFNGGTQIDGINALLIKQEGTESLPEPIELTVSEMTSDIYSYESVRVKVLGATINESNYEFNITFSDGTGSIVSFIQSFASFSGEPTPSGVVDVVGYGSFYNDPQLLINGPSDVTGGSTSGGDFPTNELSLAELKNDFLSMGTATMPEGFISGVVISDKEQGNITNRNLVFQSEGTGIVLRFGAAHNYGLGEKLKVNVSGQSFSEFNGLNQIDGLNATLIQREGNESLPEPIVVTVDDMLSDIYSYESIRVKIEGATIDGSSYASNITFTDATGSIKSFIQGFASFNGEPTPSGAVDVIGYGSLFNDPQISINGPSDVTGGSVVNPPGGDGDVNQTFEGKTDFESVDLDGWLNITTIGNTPWYFRSFDDNGFVECEAFQSDDPQTETWLITPVIDTDEKSIFSFETSQAFWKHQGLSVWISPEFTNLDDAEWVEITEANIASISDPQYEFVSSGEIDLKSIESGKVRVGWKYEGTSGANTTKMRIDNVVLK